MKRAEFYYGDILRKPPVPFNEQITEKICRRCSATFTTKSRIKKRCPSCQSAVNLKSRKASNDRQSERRRAKKVL